MEPTPNQTQPIHKDPLSPRTEFEVTNQEQATSGYNTGFSPSSRPIQSTGWKEDTTGWKLGTNGEVEFNGARTVSTNFRPVIKAFGCTIYISNGTSPNGNLSGNSGDICFGADSGKAYKCTTTTTWVSFT